MEEYDWSSDVPTKLGALPFDVILGTDVAYYEHLYAPFIQASGWRLAPDTSHELAEWCAAVGTCSRKPVRLWGSSGAQTCRRLGGLLDVVCQGLAIVDILRDGRTVGGHI